MLLEKLVEYTQVQLSQTAPPAGYQKGPIRYILALAPDGQPEGMFDTATRDLKRGETRLAPHAKRSVGIVPKLLADTGEYAFGIPRNDAKKKPNLERIDQQFDQFRDLAVRCAAETNEPSVMAVASFYETFEPGSAPDWLPPDYDASATITFRIGPTTFPIDLPSVRAWWAASRAPDTSEGAAGNIMTCIVCGAIGPVLERHPLKIKGIPGGQVLKDLISANAGAFESYGLKASMTAPTCSTCAEAYGNALNALLDDEQTHLWTSGLAFAFWTDPKASNPFEPVDLLKRPDDKPAEVARLLTAFFRGDTDPLLIDPTAFYSVALGASGSRVAVRDWIDSTVGNARRSMARYFALQQMVEWNGEPGNPLPLFMLTGATVRRKETPPDIVVQSLMRLALHGTSLPDDVLFMAVRRNRAEQRVTRSRAALIRMVLDGGEDITVLKENRMAGLDSSRPDPAYVCGRLLAIADQIQFSTLGEVNSSVVDKFFGSASSNPGLVFPIINRGTQFHLKRLARDNSKARRSLQAQLEDVAAMIDDYPPRLNLREQGLFALGFYHQRAADRAARKSASEAKKARTQEQPSDDGGDEE